MGIKTMKAFSRQKDIPTQVPPLTPGTNKTMAEALKASFASWEKEQVRLNITKGESGPAFRSPPLIEIPSGNNSENMKGSLECC
jgi:hypothetical protein